MLRDEAVLLGQDSPHARVVTSSFSTNSSLYCLFQIACLYLNFGGHTELVGVAVVTIPGSGYPRRLGTKLGQEGPASIQRLLCT